MSRIGAKKKFASTSSNGSNTGKKRSVTNAKVTGRPSTSSKATVQKYPQNTKRIKTRKGRDEDVRQSIDAKWKNRNENIPHENRESQKNTKNAMTRSDLASTIAKFDNLLQN